MTTTITKADIDLYRRFQKSPIEFIRCMWKLVPQPIKPEYQVLVDRLVAEGNLKAIKAEYFGEFIKNKHITWQQWLLLKAVEIALAGGKRRISVVSGHGCHAIDTQILMFDGTVKAVQDIKIGDQLMGDDNSPREVLSLARGKEQMYRIKYFDGSFYDVNESHILSLVASQSHGKQVRGNKKDISVKEYLKWSERKKRTNIGYKSVVEFSEKELPIEPYLLGLWLGDGTGRNGNITNEDKEILEYLDNLGSTKRAKKNNCYVICVPGLTKLLRINKLQNNKHIPQIYKTASIKQRRELLAGLLDTDGSRDNFSYEITQKNKQLAEDIVFIARSIGSHATIKKVYKTCTNSKKGRVVGEYWRVWISRNTWNIPVKIARKKINKPRKPQREKLNFGFSVSKLETSDYYGFTLNNNGRFLLGDFTVTHNTGKSCTLSWLILWFLFCFKDAQIPCTAPTSNQMHDILWKELALWHKRMPAQIQGKYEWSSEYMRISESRETWFARARTASKENSEALAGVHGDHVMALVDEASGVEDEIFNTAEGALTGPTVLVIMISNGTRLIGYFHDSHHLDAHNWQGLSFNAEESPIVDKSFIERIAEKHGRDSDEYAIRVKGGFGREEGVDDQGFVPLLVESDLKNAQDEAIRGRIRLGVDPAGDGGDKMAQVGRDHFKAKVLNLEEKNNPKSIAGHAVTNIKTYTIAGDDVGVDNFGIGANVAQEIALADMGEGKKPIRVEAINVGDDAEDWERFFDRRAELAWRMREWVKAGGEFVNLDKWKEELLSLRYRRTTGKLSKIQIMSKRVMKKLGLNHGKSPNRVDALMLTFIHPNIPQPKSNNKELEPITDYGI